MGWTQGVLGRGKSSAYSQAGDSLRPVTGSVRGVAGLWQTVLGRGGGVFSETLHSMECNLELSSWRLHDGSEGLCLPRGVEGDPLALLNIARAPLRLSTFKDTKHSHQWHGDARQGPLHAQALSTQRRPGRLWRRLARLSAYTPA